MPNYIKTNLALTDENVKLIEKLIIENNIEPSKIIPEHVTKECLKNAKYLEQKYNLPYSVEIEIDIDKIGNNFKENKEYTKLLDESLQSKKQQDDFWKAIVNTEHSKEKFTLPDDSIHKEFYDIAISFIDPDKPMPEYFNFHTYHSNLRTARRVEKSKNNRTRISKYIQYYKTDDGLL